MRLVTFAVLAFLFAGCAVHIETQQPPNSDQCRLARVAGVVVLDPQVGLGLRDQQGAIHRVIWPFGFSARRDTAGVVLVDGDGRVVAREGDEIASAGFTRDDGVKLPCGRVEVIR